MIAAALAAAALAGGARDLVRTSDVTLPEGERTVAAFADDLNADGRLDLVCVSVTADAGLRRLRIWYARKDEPRFAALADRELALTPDVIALSSGDVDPAAGREIVLWNGGGAFAWMPAAPPEASFARLGTAPLLWQRPRDRRVLVWSAGVRDLDGDGLDDLLTPGIDGYRVLLQRREDGRARFVESPLLAVDPSALTTSWRRDIRVDDGLEPKTSGLRRGYGGGGGFELSFGSGGGRVTNRSAPLLNHSARVPAPLAADFDADGTLDCFAQTARELLVWKGWSSGGEPDVRMDLPIELDRARRLDLSYAAALGELDGDGRADVVMFAGDQRSGDVRTQVLVYRASAVAAGEPPLFGARGAPTQLLILAGFAGRARLTDVNHDGLDDLVAASVRPDLLGALAGSEQVELEILVYLSDAGTFPRKPSLSARLQLAANALLEGYSFVDDATGDGVDDLLVNRGDDVALYGVRPARGGRGASAGLDLLTRPVFTLRLEDKDELEVDHSRSNVRMIVRGPSRVRLLEVVR